MTFGWDYTINFAHNPIVSSSDMGPRTAVAVITSIYRLKKLTYGPRLYYRINNGSFNFVNYNYNNLDTFRFTIPGQSQGSIVDYYIAAQDSLANFVGTLPMGGKGLNPPGTVPPPAFLQYTVLTGVASNNEPVKFSLEQNYPNPFNPATNITFTLGKQSNVRIVVYDVLGRQIEELLNQKYTAGSYNVVFDGRNVSSGVYYYSMSVDGELFSTKKMILSK
jgi:hypothetical protein